VNAAATCLVVLARAPELGRVKTRLAAAVGPGAALRVYRQLLARTATAALAWPGPRLLASTGDATAFAGTGFEHLQRQEQASGDLGARIARGLANGLDRAEAALVIGSDCPALTTTHLAAVAELLASAPVAFGPADDGGFWAIAARDRRAVALLATLPVPWSSPTTLATLQHELAAAGLASVHGPALADLDTAEDLAAAIAAGSLAPHQP
jgi:uncharacterized protein